MLFWLALTACNPPSSFKKDSEPVLLNIVALNDFHGALYETPVKGVEGKVAGGLPWLVGAVEALRQQNPELLLLDGGDLFQGSWPVNATQGMGSVEAYNLLGVDVAVLGNHEFDYGGIPGGHPLRGALEEAAKNAKYTWLSSNIRLKDGQRWEVPGIEPWTLIERKGVKIAVIGLTTVDTPQTTLSKNVADLTFIDPVVAVKELLPEIEASGAQVTAIVGHLTGKCEPKGYFDPGEPCLPDGEIGKLLTELPRGTIDLMVLGHAHTLLAHRWEDTFILENRAQGHALGRLDLMVGPTGVIADQSVLHPPLALLHEPSDPGCAEGEYKGQPQQISDLTVTPSISALELVKSLEKQAGSLCDEIGCNKAALWRSREKESGVGNLVADAMLSAFPSADFAVQNSGGLRADLPEGTLRREHAQAVMPFDNRLFLVELSGSEVQELFRLGSSGAHGILQVAGAQYHFDPEKTGGSDLDGDGATADWERDRLCPPVKVKNEQVKPEENYKVVLTDFLLEGGDHLGHALKEAKILEEGPLLRDTLIQYIDDLPQCVGETTPLLDSVRARIDIGSCGSR